MPPRSSRRRKRNKESSPLGLALLEALKSKGLGDLARRIRITQIWRSTVGPTVAKRTEPVNFNRGTLVVRAVSPAWQNELIFLRQDLIAKLNEALGSQTVKALKIISGVKRANEIPRNEVPAPWLKDPVDARDIARAKELGEAISDPNIRGAFVDLMEIAQRAKRSKERLS